jgi:hypothetical protein
MEAAIDQITDYELQRGKCQFGCYGSIFTICPLLSSVHQTPLTLIQGPFPGRIGLVAKLGLLELEVLFEEVDVAAFISHVAS